VDCGSAGRLSWHSYQDSRLLRYYCNLTTLHCFESAVLTNVRSDTRYGNITWVFVDPSLHGSFKDLCSICCGLTVCGIGIPRNTHTALTFTAPVWLMLCCGWAAPLTARRLLLSQTTTLHKGTPISHISSLSVKYSAKLVRHQVSLDSKSIIQNIRVVFNTFMLPDLFPRQNGLY
jgi:hypothetical protein